MVTGSLVNAAKQRVIDAQGSLITPDYFFYEVVTPNIEPKNDSRPTKAIARNTLYRDVKSKTHRTKKGVGVIGKLFNK